MVSPWRGYSPICYTLVKSAQTPRHSVDRHPSRETPFRPILEVDKAHYGETRKTHPTAGTELTGAQNEERHQHQLRSGGLARRSSVARPQPTRRVCAAATRIWCALRTTVVATGGHGGSSAATLRRSSAIGHCSEAAPGYSRRTRLRCGWGDCAPSTVVSVVNGAANAVYGTSRRLLTATDVRRRLRASTVVPGVHPAATASRLRARGAVHTLPPV
jgi:hypothetical protein